MKWIFLVLLIIGSAFGAVCPDVNGRSVEIGGNEITGWVRVKRAQYLRFTWVQISMAGKTVARQRTDEYGRFYFSRLQIGEYRLSVKGWGNTVIRINPQRKIAGQSAVWQVWLTEDRCASWLAKVG